MLPCSSLRIDLAERPPSRRGRTARMSRGWPSSVSMSASRSGSLRPVLMPRAWRIAVQNSHRDSPVRPPRGSLYRRCAGSQDSSLRLVIRTLLLPPWIAWRKRRRSCKSLDGNSGSMPAASLPDADSKLSQTTISRFSQRVFPRTVSFWSVLSVMNCGPKRARRCR